MPTTLRIAQALAVAARRQADDASAARAVLLELDRYGVWLCRISENDQGLSEERILSRPRLHPKEEDLPLPFEEAR